MTSGFFWAYIIPSYPRCRRQLYCICGDVHSSTTCQVCMWIDLPLVHQEHTHGDHVYMFFEPKLPFTYLKFKNLALILLTYDLEPEGGGTSLTIICSALPPNNIFCSCMDRKLLTWKKIFLDIDQMCTVGQSAHVHFNP